MTSAAKDRNTKQQTQTYIACGFGIVEFEESVERPFDTPQSVLQVRLETECLQGNLWPILSLIQVEEVEGVHKG